MYNWFFKNIKYWYFKTNNLFVENNLKTSQINKLNSFNRIEFDNDTTKIISKFYPTNMIDSNSISGVQIKQYFVLKIMMYILM